MSAGADSAHARAAVRMRRVDAGVVAQMARSLHRDARHERAGARESGERAREVACAIEVGRVRRAPVTRPHPGPALVSPAVGARLRASRRSSNSPSSVARWS
jgi:hypothetical protein